MSAVLPAIPQPDTLTIAEARDVCASVVQWANECDDAETVLRAREAFRVVAEYLRINDAAREGEAAMRYLEMRIGELAGPAVNGGDRRSVQFERKQTELNWVDSATLHRFRQMAAHPDVVEQVIADSTQQSPPSRNKVLNAIRELERAANEAKADAEAFKAGLAEQREWAAGFKPKEGDDWRRRQRTETAALRFIRELGAFVDSMQPDDLTHAIETGVPHLAHKLKAELSAGIDALEPYREAVQ